MFQIPTCAGAVQCQLLGLPQANIVVHRRFNATGLLETFVHPGRRFGPRAIGRCQSRLSSYTRTPELRLVASVVSWPEKEQKGATTGHLEHLPRVFSLGGRSYRRSANHSSSADTQRKCPKVNTAKHILYRSMCDRLCAFDSRSNLRPHVALLRKTCFVNASGRHGGEPRREGGSTTSQVGQSLPTPNLGRNADTVRKSSALGANEKAQ